MCVCVCVCVCFSRETERLEPTRDQDVWWFGLPRPLCFVRRISQGKPPKPVATPRHSPPYHPPYHRYTITESSNPILYRTNIRMVPRRRTTISHEPTTTTSRHHDHPDSGTARPSLPIGLSSSSSPSPYWSASASSRWWNAQMTRRSTKRRIPRIGAWMALVVVCGIQWYGMTQVVWFLENDTTTSSTTTTLVRPMPRSKQPPSGTRSAVVMSRAPPHSQSQSQPQAVSFSDSHPHPLTGLLANNTNHNTNHTTTRIRLVYWNGREESWFDDPSEESSSTRSPPGSNDWLSSVWESLSQLVSQDVTVERGGSTRTTTTSSLHHHVSLSSGNRRTTTTMTIHVVDWASYRSNCQAWQAPLVDAPHPEEHDEDSTTNGNHTQVWIMWDTSVVWHDLMRPTQWCRGLGGGPDRTILLVHQAMVQHRHWNPHRQWVEPGTMVVVPPFTTNNSRRSAPLSSNNHNTTHDAASGTPPPSSSTAAASVSRSVFAPPVVSDVCLAQLWHHLWDLPDHDQENNQNDNDNRHPTKPLNNDTLQEMVTRIVTRPRPLDILFLVPVFTTTVTDNNHKKHQPDTLEWDTSRPWTQNASLSSSLRQTPYSSLRRLVGHALALQSQWRVEVAWTHAGLPPYHVARTEPYDYRHAGTHHHNHNHHSSSKVEDPTEPQTTPTAHAVSSCGCPMRPLLDAQVVVMVQADEWEGAPCLFEALASGAVVVTDAMQHSPLGIQNGTTVSTFDSLDSLERLLQYWLTNTTGVEQEQEDKDNQQQQQQDWRRRRQQRRQVMTRQALDLVWHQHRPIHRLEQVLWGQTRSSPTAVPLPSLVTTTSTIHDPAKQRTRTTQSKDHKHSHEHHQKHHHHHTSQNHHHHHHHNSGSNHGTIAKKHETD